MVPINDVVVSDDQQLVFMIMPYNPQGDLKSIKMKFIHYPTRLLRKLQNKSLKY